MIFMKSQSSIQTLSNLKTPEKIYKRFILSFDELYLEFSSIFFHNILRFFIQVQ